jgi:hypothetical protein
MTPIALRHGWRNMRALNIAFYEVKRKRLPRPKAAAKSDTEAAKENPRDCGSGVATRLICRIGMPGCIPRVYDQRT